MAELRGGSHAGERVDTSPELGGKIRAALPDFAKVERFLFFIKHEGANPTPREVYGLTEHVTHDGLPIYEYRPDL